MNPTNGLGLGWLVDHPSLSDYHPEHPKVSKFFEERNLIGDSAEAPLGVTSEIPESGFSPIENQQSLGSCTAQAGIGLMEYYQKKTKGKFIDMSRLFLYKATRNMMGVTGDTGAYLRSTMGAMVLFGVPPEHYMPYDITKFDEEPSAFLYSFAKEFQSVTYLRLDPLGMSRDRLLQRIKSFINRKMPSMFGFTVYNSISQAGNNNGEIPFPCSTDRVNGGHAVVAIGYDDQKKITNSNCGKETTGAIRIRNSWGTSWGDSGYGWLPYDYVLRGLAVDWWTLIRNEWVNTDIFKA